MSTLYIGFHEDYVKLTGFRPKIQIPKKRKMLIPNTFRQRLQGTRSLWIRYEIGTDKACVYVGPAGSGTGRIFYLVPNGSTNEGNLIWNRTVPVSNPSRVNRVRTTVDRIPNGSEHI